MRPGTWVLVAGLAACDTPSTPCTRGTVVLAQPGAWQRADTEADPFADHRPDEVVCPAYALTVEGPALEVDTGACRYATLVQPMPQALPAGTEVTARVAHLDLVAPERAEAHVALAVAGAVGWSTLVPIPSAPAVLEVRFSLPEAVPAGAPLAFHVHNHGANRWLIFDVVAEDVCRSESTP